ncbi:MAG: RluA family pseudouridine synthase [Acidimicrobiales bacterium]
MIWSVPGPLAGERLDRVVALLGDVSRSAAAGSVAEGQVSVNGEVVLDRARRVALDDVIEASLPAPAAPLEITADPTIPFAVRHEDEHLLVIDKPAGVVVHPGAGRSTGTLCHGLLARYPDVAGVGEEGRPGIVHRLDRGTSGLLVVARTEEAYQALVELLSRHQIDREYLAMVWGSVDGPEGVVDGPIGRSRRDPTKMTVTPRGKPARTRYRVESALSDPSRTLLRCWLETGRTHQIRVHLASIGHPVVADAVYRGAPLPNQDLDRPWLHARRLQFVHPIVGDDIVVESELPPDLQATMQA